MKSSCMFVGSKPTTEKMNYIQIGGYPRWPKISINTEEHSEPLPGMRNRIMQITHIKTAIRCELDGVWYVTCVSNDAITPKGTCATQQLSLLIESVYHTQVAFSAEMLKLSNVEGDRVWLRDPDQRSELTRVVENIMDIMEVKS